MYQALYRKWRPRTFSEVVGQAHITTTLQRQVAEGRTAHAYLFTGTRGTGKTTCARILAKAVNCLNPIDGAPCCECEACRGIESGRALDVTELDAASNNGVDQVRALREEAVYTPSVLRKRVYIIDEVHMLSAAAFNALLKILEEPPEHLLFILATTELHKVPATILSRCQRFTFKRILPRDIEQQLLKIAETEQITLAPDGAEILARMANGALRDALSLLDQCRVVEGSIDSRAVLDVLGLAGSVQTVQLMRCILSENVGDALALFDQLYRGGKDVAALLSELSDLGRDLTISRAAPEGGAALLSGLYDRKTLAELGKDQPMQRFLYLTDTLQACCAALPNSIRPRTDAELCLLKLCDETLSGDLTGLVRRMAKLENAVKKGIPAAPAATPQREMPRYEEPPRFEEAPPFEDAPPLPEEPPVPDEPLVQKSTEPPASAAGGDDVWSRLIEHYKGRLAVNQRVFLNMSTGTMEGDCLKVWCNNDFVKSSLDIPAVRDVLLDVTSAELGHPIRLEFVVGKAPNSGKSTPVQPIKRPAPPPAPKAAPAPQEIPPWEEPPIPEEAPPLPEEPAMADDGLEGLAKMSSELENFMIR